MRNLIVWHWKGLLGCLAVIILLLAALVWLEIPNFIREPAVPPPAASAPAPKPASTSPPITVTAPPVTVTATAPPVTVSSIATTLPSPIIWPKTDLKITGDEARKLLTGTFTNRRMTGAHFSQAALYTLGQFQEIRTKMAPLADNHLPWPSLIDKALGSFQEPGIEDLPVGWAYPTNDPMYLIVILQDGAGPKIFGFDPLEKAKIWEVTTDSRVECAIVR